MLSFESEGYGVGQGAFCHAVGLPAFEAGLEAFSAVSKICFSALFAQAFEAHIGVCGKMIKAIQFKQNNLGQNYEKRNDKNKKTIAKPLKAK